MAGMAGGNEGAGGRGTMPAGQGMEGRRSERADLTDPHRQGYRMPAEWEPHAATWLAWPHNLDTWPHDLDRVRLTWVEFIRALVPGERVHLLVNGAAAGRDASTWLERGGVDPGGVTLHYIPTVDVWIRDYGPTFITRRDSPGALAFVNWRFNAWGLKYPEYVADDAVPEKLNEALRLPAFTPGIVLEGGSIDVNGAGLCLVTEECLLNPNRNPGRERKDIEALLERALGLERVLWLPAGMAGDDTDGHIDNLARFVDGDTVACVVEPDPADENHRALQENYRCLAAATDAAGRRLRVVPLPQPDPVTADGARLPASYANFYIANGVVLVPLYGGPKDRAALDTLADLFPDRRIAGIDARALILGLGGIHCVTQQEPAT
ncbi:MAG: agmatine deiminase family protein [Deltaproteobacteria bacterium]|nr:agmatine deiminase family protein [Deltaproteobacteria bacterium]